MIEITPAGLIAVVLATVFLTSMIWLGVAVILAGRAQKAEADEAFDHGYAAGLKDGEG